MSDSGFRSPWVGVDPRVDPVRWARILQRAHRFATQRGETPPLLRSVVASSWRRAAECGVDPDGRAPMKLDPTQTERALARHSVAHLLPMVGRLLGEATEAAEYFAVLSDAEGVLLWVDGHSKALDSAVGPGFLPGHLCSEGAVGTNAVGTALALDHPVQIFSAEHFNRRLHGLTCAAAPIRDPESGRTIGVLNLSGSFRTGHPHSLALVTSVARVIEVELRRELARRDDALRARYIDFLAQEPPGRSALVAASGRVLAASPRGWLGKRLRIGADGQPVLPAGAELKETVAGGGGEAFLVGAGRRRREPPSVVSVEAIGPSRARVTIGDWEAELSPRHSQLLMMLAIHPAGLRIDELRAAVYGDARSPVTVRAEMSRLRRLLGPVLTTNPYRLEAPVEVDRAAVERALGLR